MTKNGAKIKQGIRTLLNKEYEIVSGSVVPGSVDMSRFTVSVQPTDNSEPIEQVMLNAVAENGNGMILVPADGSNVVIGSIDGPGEWTLIRTSDIARVIVTIESVRCEIDGTQIKIQNGDVVLGVTDSVFKMNTAGESLFQLLKDCFTYISALTVPTPSGTSSVPVNVADFNNLITRLDNLLTS